MGLDVVFLVLGVGLVNFAVSRALERRLQAECGRLRTQVAALAERLERLEKQ